MHASLNDDITNEIYEYLPPSEFLRLDEVAGHPLPSNPISENEIRNMSLVQLNVALQELSVRGIPSTMDKNELANLLRTNKTRIVI